MSENLRITSLDQLVTWNLQQSINEGLWKVPLKMEEKPILMDWFLDWFFELLEEWYNEEHSVFRKFGHRHWMKTRKLKLAYEELNKFTVFCEGMTEAEAKERTDGNLGYYSGYRARWRTSLIEFMQVLEK